MSKFVPDYVSGETAEHPMGRAKAMLFAALWLVGAWVAGFLASSAILAVVLGISGSIDLLSSSEPLLITRFAAGVLASLGAIFLARRMHHSRRVPRAMAWLFGLTVGLALVGLLLTSLLGFPPVK